VFFLTRRPETGGAPAQAQTERWLERHGFARPCVHIVRGSRGKLVHALGLDLLIDDTLANCLDVALESKAACILIWTGDASHAQRSLRGMNVDIAESLGDAVERLTGRTLLRNRRPASAPESHIATAHTPLASASAPESHIATADRPKRSTYALAAFLFGMFAVYGSLVPLEFRALPFDEAVARFSNIRYLRLGIGSRADFVANILLFIPLGVLLAGACLVDRPGRLRTLLSVLIIVPLLSALSMAIEFTQVFFPRRTVSLNDITAETAGGAIGVAFWLLVGQSSTEWLRAFARERRRPALVVQLLTVYGVGFIVSQWMPFDITIDLGELADKYDAGRIVTIPFTHAYPSPIALVWDYATDIVLWFPIGALAALGWTRTECPRTPLHAVAIGGCVVGLIEIGQVFVFTRYADTTDLLTGSLGIAVGAAAAAAMAGSNVEGRFRTGTPTRLWLMTALIGWVIVLAVYSWAPFDFILDRNVLRQRVDMLFVVPFRNYYFGSEFHAFTEITRKFMFALPVGALLRLALPFDPDRAVGRLRTAMIVAAGLTIFTGLEAVQILLPARFADITDVLIAVCGVETARRLVDRLRAAAPEQDKHSLEVNRYAVR
jgi:glycopeptide antibiotics resistance protein